MIQHYLENYIQDNNSLFDIERSAISTRNNLVDTKKTTVQQSIQNNYYTANFNQLDNNNNNYQNSEINNFLMRNPVNTRRDDMEKIRNMDRQNFLNSQGGNLNNFTNFKLENTRKNRNEINSTNYIPMAKTMAIPKDNI